MWANQESQRAWCISGGWLVINQAFAERGLLGTGRSLRRPPGAVPYGEARRSERPPYTVPQVSRVAFNRHKWPAITTGCNSCCLILTASCSFYDEEMSGSWHNWGFYESVYSEEYSSLSWDALRKAMGLAG